VNDTGRGPSRYDYEVAAGEDTVQGKLLALVPDGGRVLDLGCAAGALDRPLADRGCRVTGVEMDPIAAKAAGEWCDEVIVADLDGFDPALLGERRFDVIVAADVLEHLRDPGGLLTALRPYLVPGGHLVTCIPNVAHAAVRLALLHGDFPYAELGLLDATHLRFWTRDTFAAVLADHGFTVLHVGRQRAELRATEIPLAHVPADPHVEALLAEDPEATVYQYVMLAVPTDDLAGAAGMRSRLLARLSHERDQAAQALGEGREGALAACREELARQADTADLLRAEVAALTEEIAVSRQEQAGLASAGEQLAQIRGSKLWRVATIYRRGVEAVRRRAR
jgi:2-polyprenyl-3-methyl-5-hydroxy-6-metoxy-1,4-benzoquinol methylase